MVFAALHALPASLTSLAAWGLRPSAQSQSCAVRPSSSRSDL